jgi:Protein of unknown function (DUF2505)
MRFERSTTIPARGPEVFHLMTSETFQRLKASAIGALSCSCEVACAPDGTVTVVTDRVVPAGTVPELIRALVRPTLSVRETERWGLPASSAHLGEFLVAVSGAPVSVAGTVALESVPSGCRLTFAGDLVTSVPLFRAAIERAAAGQVLATIDAEFALLHELLAAPAAPGTPA